MCSAKTQISLVWSESLLSAWRSGADNKANLSLHWVHRSFCWVLSCGGSLIHCSEVTVMIQSIWTFKSGQTVQTKITLFLKLLKVQSDPSQYCSFPSTSFEPVHGKINSLMRVFAACLNKVWVHTYLYSTQQILYSDQTGWMPRLIWVFAGRTGQIVCRALHHLEALFYDETTLFKFKDKYHQFLGCLNFSDFCGSCT